MKQGGESRDKNQWRRCEQRRGSAAGLSAGAELQLETDRGGVQ